MNLSKCAALLVSATAPIWFATERAYAQSAVPPELQTYYDANVAAIKELVTLAESKDASIEKRRAAFQQLRIGYPRAALDTAIKLSAGENLTLAIEGTTFLTSIVVMMNHGTTLDSHDKHSGDNSVSRAVVALRKSSLDPRQEIREIAAASLASLDDEPTLKALQQSATANKVSDVEALRYITLSKPSVGADYAAPFLKNGSASAKSEAIGYLSESEQYRPIIKTYLFSEEAPVEVRSAAARSLARNDPTFGTYAPALVADQKLPAAVFDGLVSEMSVKLAPGVVTNVLSKALESPLDRAKIDTLSKSINRYEALRPEIDVGKLQGSIKRLNPT